MLDEVFRELLVLESNAKAIEHRLNALTHCIYDTPAEQKMKIRSAARGRKANKRLQCSKEISERGW